MRALAWLVQDASSHLPAMSAINCSGPGIKLSVGRCEGRMKLRGRALLFIFIKDAPCG
jgi:hypothetical protein